ncbi:hypothetical protein N1030_06945 [Desulfovibrio mangrovi]|uniref:hypothetical protein n=1 Tax=Desulfovibrio mangrovi TaxID=2976983 RepID=UPI0022474C49|nr:hypothetical protein [Desulfovibrio mangrovi]UZP68700.1 hypothetical protein N1030_06945 [Desulfovibrio mangrovi]
MQEYSIEAQVVERVEALYEGQRAVHVSASDILILMEGKRAIARSAIKVAEAVGLRGQDVVNNLFDNMYYVEPSGSLVMAIYMPEHGLELFAEVPARMWTFKGQSHYLN